MIFLIVNQKTTFNLTEDDFNADFKDDYAHKPTTTTKSVRKEVDDFVPFQPTPNPTPVQPTPVPVKPLQQNNNNTSVAWDPFSPQQPVQPVLQTGWDDFDPRGNGANNNNANIFSPISLPINNPVIPPMNNNVIPPTTTNPPLSNSLPPNLFTTPAVIPISTLPLTHNNSKPNMTTPVKSNDPWEAHHLYNLSANPTSPRTNSVNTMTAKPLGATVGTGWNTTVPVTTVPMNYAHGYPTNVGYPVTYATYPVTTPNTTYNTPNYSNTSQWGI